MFLIKSYLAQPPQETNRAVSNYITEGSEDSSHISNRLIFKWCFGEERLNDVLEVLQYD